MRKRGSGRELVKKILKLCLDHPQVKLIGKMLVGKEKLPRSPTGKTNKDECFSNENTGELTLRSPTGRTKTGKIPRSATGKTNTDENVCKLLENGP